MLVLIEKNVKNPSDKWYEFICYKHLQTGIKILVSHNFWQASYSFE